MNKLKLFILSTLLGLSALAQQTAVATLTTGGTAYNVLANPAAISSITFTSTTTNPAVLYLFDSATTTTNYVQAAYTGVTSYSTNWALVWTNESDIVITNTFVGTWTGPTTVSATTNTLPVLAAAVAPGNGQSVRALNLNTTRGITAVASTPGILQINYRR